LKKQLLFAIVLGLGSCTPAVTPTTPPFPTSTLIPTDTAWPTAFATTTPTSTSTPTKISFTTTATLEPIPTTWSTYTNAEHGFAIDYPADMTLETQSQQIILSRDADSPWDSRWYLRTERNYTPADALYFLDTPSNGQITTGRTTWTTYYLPHGYCDGPSCSPPIFALQVEFDHTLYTAFFYNQSSLTELQIQVLSTFRLLK
jgi:hypothetical protein